MPPKSRKRPLADASVLRRSKRARHTLARWDLWLPLVARFLCAEDLAVISCVNSEWTKELAVDYAWHDQALHLLSELLTLTLVGDPDREGEDARRTLANAGLMMKSSFPWKAAVRALYTPCVLHRRSMRFHQQVDDRWQRARVPENFWSARSMLPNDLFSGPAPTEVYLKRPWVLIATARPSSDGGTLIVNGETVRPHANGEVRWIDVARACFPQLDFSLYCIGTAPAFLRACPEVDRAIRSLCE